MGWRVRRRRATKVAFALIPTTATIETRRDENEVSQEGESNEAPTAATDALETEHKKEH